MFPSPLTGELYHPDSAVNLHKKILRGAGLDHFRFYDLRHHRPAKRCRRENRDLHAGILWSGFTLHIDTHATRQKQGKAAQTMANIIEQVM